MKSKQTFCVGGRHKNNTINKIKYEKSDPETQKTLKIIKGTCNVSGRFKSQVFTK